MYERFYKPGTERSLRFSSISQAAACAVNRKTLIFTCDEHSNKIISNNSSYVTSSSRVIHLIEISYLTNLGERFAGAVARSAKALRLCLGDCGFESRYELYCYVMLT